MWESPGQARHDWSQSDDAMNRELVLVTGGTGFLGSHCIVRIVADGYRVRTTLRSPAREAEVRAMVREGGADDGALEFTKAELGSDAGWAEAVSGCAYVVHAASPFPPASPAHEDELVVPAREGTLRVLRAARDAGVRRVVLTSSFAAIGYRPAPQGRPYDERDWSDVSEPALRAYPRSKTLAERAAWDFMAAEGGGMEMAVVNPTAIFGPALGPDLSTSLLLIRRLLAGERVDTAFGVIDVRDAAHLHLLAMTQPEAAGRRFIAIAGPFVTTETICAALREGLGAPAVHVPRPPFAPPPAGAIKQVSNAAALSLAGWQPRSSAEAIVAAGRSIIRFGLLPGQPHHQEDAPGSRT
jgi:nucleoside-diphosphate-sugar epimerase